MAPRSRSRFPPTGTTGLWSCTATATWCPGSSNPATDVGDPVTRQYLLGQGFALAGSSYKSTGWAVKDALVDQIALLDHFTATYGRPERTIAWGHSLGGMVTAGLVQRHPDRFAGALPMCGVLAGGVGVWNTALDAEFVFKTLLAPPTSTLQLVNIDNPQANLGQAEGPAGRGSGDAAGPGASGAVGRYWRPARVVFACASRTGCRSVCGSGAKPVPLGPAGRFSLPVCAARRVGVPRRGQPLVEHARGPTGSCWSGPSTATRFGPCTPPRASAWIRTWRRWPPRRGSAPIRTPCGT